MKAIMSKPNYKMLLPTAVILIVFVVALRLSRPERVGLPRNAVEIKEVMLPNGKGILLTAHPMNYLGQIQGVGIKIDAEKKRFLIDRYVVRWHPLSRFTTHNDFPVVIETKDLSPGRYEILAWNRSEGYLSIGTFQVSTE